MRITFDQIEVGAEIVTAGRTITEADIVNFAGLSGDFNALHTDEVWVRENTEFGGRIAHGLLIQAIGEGLRCPEIDRWLILAFLEVQRRMVKPVFPGDRIEQRFKVTEKVPSRKNPARGVVTLEVRIVNQREEDVQTGYNKYLIGGVA